MKKYSHDFVDTCDGFNAFGWDRETNEKTVICYLQMFSDDQVMQKIISRLSDGELDEIYSMINRTLKAHFKDSEYHRFFLKEDHP